MKRECAFYIPITTNRNTDPIWRSCKKNQPLYTQGKLPVEVLKKSGISDKHTYFALEATFYLDILNDSKSLPFLKENELKEKEFICVDIKDELLIDPLPEDLKPNVVKLGYWLPDEAASVYSRAQTILSFECHSPVIALAAGCRPCTYVNPRIPLKARCIMTSDLMIGYLKLINRRDIKLRKD